MMEQITIGQIAVIITFVVGVVTGVGFLGQKIKGWITNTMKDEFSSVHAQIQRLDDRISAVDMESTKNFLVDYLSRIERGEALDEIALERFWEQYEHYVQAGGNSYIRRKVDQLKTDGKL
ncbi:MAG: hypothetical protein IJI45_18380 [Anaerolineaceae bacterium]|nr:hypothetical protein [Anaerolineaceae bacterium]